MSAGELRKKIELCDRGILELLAERARAVADLSQATGRKPRTGRRNSGTGSAPTAGPSQSPNSAPSQSPNPPAPSSHDPAETKRALDRVCRLNPGPLPATSVRSVFGEILSACENLGKPMAVGFFGPEATYTHMAALDVFGAAAEFVPYRTIDDVFQACEKGWIQYGVVPIENSAAGVVHQTLDLFGDTDLIISNEIALSIHHALLANCPLEKIRRVYSHGQPFMQCRAWLKQNLPGVELVEADSTGDGARLAARHAGTAAIASELAGRLYGLKVLVRGIEDIKDNITRFWVIGREAAAATGDDKTSIMFSVKDRPGALYNLLLPFHKARINLTKIESRPTKRRPWEYLFFVDLLGHASRPKVRRVLDEIREHCDFLKIMGSYPRNDKPH